MRDLLPKDNGFYIYIKFCLLCMVKLSALGAEHTPSLNQSLYGLRFNS